MDLVITKFCRIKNNSVTINGNEYFAFDPTAKGSLFVGELYKKMNLAYPKFFKMDNLCKLGILATELVVNNNESLAKQEKDKVAIVFSNHSSCIDTDRNYQKTIQDKTQYFPSPALFVYTVTNVVVGEIAIKYKFTGENAFFVSDNLEALPILSYINAIFKNNHTTAALCGWVNVDEDNYEAFVFSVEKGTFNDAKTKGYYPFTETTINQLIK